MPGVAGQLVKVLAAPRPTGQGTYTVTIALHPDELGEVRATVTAGEDQVMVRLMASTGDGDEALRQALPQLHAGLSTGGQRTSVTVGGQGDGGGARWTTGRAATDDGAGRGPDGPGGPALSVLGDTVPLAPGTAPSALGGAGLVTDGTGGAARPPSRLIDVRV